MQSRTTKKMPDSTNLILRPKRQWVVNLPSSHCNGSRSPSLQLWRRFVFWLLACLTSQQHASVSQGRICTDNIRCCHTEIEVADPTFYLTQSPYTDIGPTSPSVDPIMPGAWQGSHWSANFEVTGMTRPGKIPSQARFNPGSFAPKADALITRPTRRCVCGGGGGGGGREGSVPPRHCSLDG